MSQIVTLNTFEFIVTFKLCASRELFQGTKQVKVWRGRGWAARGMREQFPAQDVDDLHRLGCFVMPCIVMMQDDSFRLMTRAFVLYVVFDLFQQFTVVGTVHKASFLKKWNGNWALHIPKKKRWASPFSSIAGTWTSFLLESLRASTPWTAVWTRAYSAKPMFCHT